MSATAALEHGRDDLPGGARPGRRFEDQEGARGEVGDGGLGPGEDEGEVGVAMLVERRGQADEDRVAVVQGAGVGRRADAARARSGPEASRRDVLDIGAACLDDSTLERSTSSPRHRPGLRERDREWQVRLTSAHISIHFSTHPSCNSGRELFCA